MPNVMKVRLDSNYRISKLEDTSFLVTGASDVDYIELYIPGTEINAATVGFLRADSRKVTPLLMTLQTTAADNDGVEVFELCLNDNMRVLDVEGPLQMSFVLQTISNNQITAIHATEYVTAYVRRSVASAPDELSELQALSDTITTNQATYQSQINTNTSRIATNTTNIATNFGTLNDHEGRITELEGVDAETRLTSLESTSDAQNERFQTLEDTSATHTNAIDALTTSDTEQDEEINAQRRRITSLESSDATQNHQLEQVARNTTAIEALQGSVTGWQYAMPVDSYDELPQHGADFMVYLVRDADAVEHDQYIEYVWVSELSAYEKLGKHTVTEMATIDTVVANSAAPVKSSGIYTAIDAVNSIASANTRNITAISGQVTTNTNAIATKASQDDVDIIANNQEGLQSQLDEVMGVANGKADKADVQANTAAIANHTTALLNKADKTVVDGLTTRMTTAEGSISNHTTRLESAETRISDLTADLGAKASSETVSAIDARVTSNTTALGNKADVMVTNALDDRIDNVEADIAAKAAANNVVNSIGGAKGAITLGEGLSITGQQLKATASGGGTKLYKHDIKFSISGAIAPPGGDPWRCYGYLWLATARATPYAVLQDVWDAWALYGGYGGLISWVDEDDYVQETNTFSIALEEAPSSGFLQAKMTVATTTCHQLKNARISGIADDTVTPL